MHFRHVLVATTMMACGGGSATTHGTFERSEGPSMPASAAVEPTEAELDAYGSDLPYDAAIQKSVHNAYEREEPLLDQLVYHRIRSLELDIHTRREGARAPARDWFVYHEDYPGLRGSSCAQLSDCLGQLAAFHAALPRHEVVTLFVDLKESFEPGHQPSDLDATLTRALGRENIVAPADLIAACPGATTLREAVTGACGFPTLQALRGKFVVVVTGGSSCDDSSLVSRYGAGGERTRAAFLGPGADASCPVVAYDAHPNVAFLNLSFDERARAAEARSRGLVPRVYGGGVPGGLDTAAEFAAARAAGAVHIATDKASIEQDGWARTHGVLGFPFACTDCDARIEPGALLGVESSSGDQWGTSDSSVLAYETSSSDASWSALVSVPSSHVHPFAKACLVARASKDANAANVALCRTFDGNPPRAQVRSARGAGTTSTDAPSFDGVTAETPAFLRLGVKSLLDGSEVTAAVSHDGKTWTTFATRRLAVPLPIRGVSVSSHGSGKVKALFANLTRSVGEDPDSMAPVTLSGLHRAALGKSATGQVFDGVFAR